MRLYILSFLLLFVIDSFTLYGNQRTKSDIDALVRLFEQNPSDARNTIRLLTELRKAGRSGQSFIDRYFQTQ